MTYPLHRSIFTGNGSSQDISQDRAAIPDPAIAEVANHPDRQPHLALEIQALQILNSSDDWIGVLDLEGRILFINRGGQVLLGIQDIAPFLNRSWVNFWQEGERQAAIDAIARAAAGEVCYFQGYCPTLNGEPKWWDNKISPMRGADGKVEQFLCISRDMTECRQMEASRQQLEEKSRESQKRYQAILNQAVTGVVCSDLDGKLTLVNQIIQSLADAPFGVYMIDAEFRFQQANQTAIAAFNIQPLIGRDLAEALRIIWQEPFATEAINRFRHTLATGESYSSLPMAKARADIEEIQSYDWQIHRITLSDGRYGVVCYFYDLSEIKRAEEIIRRNGDRDSFLVTLNDALRPLTDALEIQATANRVLGEYLETTRVTYFEVRGANYVVGQDYVNGVESLQGGYPIESFGAELLATYRSGHTALSADVATDPHLSPDQRSAYLTIQIASYIGVPLVKQGEFVAGLAIHSSTPRNWTPDEIALAEEVAERTWAAVERARAEADLRESKARLAADLAGMRRLYDLYATLATGLDLKTALNEILAVACEFTYTDRGCVQLVSDDGTRLEMFTWRGYSDDSPFINHFRYEGFKQDCDRTWVARQHFTIEETIGYPGLEGTEAGAATYAEGIRAVQSTPIVNRSGEAIGVLSTQFSQPHLPSDDELRLVDLLAWTAADFVERYRAHTALRESEEKYRSLFESIDEGFCLIEVLFDDTGKAVDYRFLEANPAFEKHTGLVDVIGISIRELVPQHETYWFEIYGRIALTGVPERFENAAQELGRFYDVYAFRMGEPQERKVAVLFNDISKRKQVEATLAADLRDTQRLRDLSARLATEESIQALYQEIMAAAIALTHADAGMVQILDETTQDLVLLATQGIEQKMVKHFHRVNTCSPTPCGIALRKGIRSFVDFDVPDESEDPDGSMRIHVAAGLFSAQSTPLISRSGKPIGIVSTHWRTHHRPSERELRFLDLLARQAADLIEQRQDAAQRKQLLEREQVARAEAERANQIKDEFLAVLSHELRSPLNPILGWTRLLQNGKLNTIRQRDALATIERNAKLQTQLIEDLLDISRIMQGKLSLTVAPVSLTFVISAAVETVRLATEAKTIQMILDLAEVAPVSGDAARLQQVVWNLLTNAVKFTPSGGQVTLELRQLDRLAQIRVIDTGKGITPKFLPHVFEYFLQEDGSTTRKFGGLGLGLAIVRQIVQMHGGTVWAESQGEGQGATFVVQLPTMQQRVVMSEPSRPQNDVGWLLGGIQVLLVDDEPDTREFQAFLLEQSGAKVTAVASGLEALQALEQSIPDVVVSDIGMAEMDGYMLLQQIRLRPFDRGGTIPAIALTAYAAEIDRQRVLQSGFQAHITKPVESEALVRAIASLLEGT